MPIQLTRPLVATNSQVLVEKTTRACSTIINRRRTFWSAIRLRNSGSFKIQTWANAVLLCPNHSLGSHRRKIRISRCELEVRWPALNNVSRSPELQQLLSRYRRFCSGHNSRQAFCNVRRTLRYHSRASTYLERSLCSVRVR